MGCPPGKDSYLLVEGINDQRVIQALCAQHQVPETFEVCFPGNGGIEAVLEAIPLYLKMSGLQTFGVVIDADVDIQACWNRVRDRLQKAQYDVPKQPIQEGFIALLPNRPRIGIWLMPDNQLPGMLEDFVGYLIPQKDRLKPVAEKTLQSIEKKSLNLYRPSYRSKAFIHTWLAWQETPGMPMQAITAQVLQHNQPLASHFVDWLKNLFV